MIQAEAVRYEWVAKLRFSNYWPDFAVSAETDCLVFVPGWMLLHRWCIESMTSVYRWNSWADVNWDQPGYCTTWTSESLNVQPLRCIAVLQSFHALQLNSYSVRLRDASTHVYSGVTRRGSGEQTTRVTPSRGVTRWHPDESLKYFAAEFTEEAITWKAYFG